MTYKEKAKAYDEAIRKAAILYKASEPMSACNVIIETIFHELKESEESEGEKIREKLIDTFNFYDSAMNSPYLLGIHRNDIVAWLEKQGEPTEINPSEFDLRLNRLLKQFETLPKEELASSLSFYINVVQNNGTYKEEKQGKQKPAWSEEDEKMYRGVMAVCDVWSTATSFCPKENEDVERLKNWLKSLKTRMRQK